MRRLVDGMEVVSSDEIGIDIEDVLYSDDSGVSECYSQEEFSAGLKAYESAQLIKTLALLDSYRELVKMAEQEAILARERENNYDGVDAIKVATLRQRRIVAQSTSEFLRNTVESAASVQRPVLVREQ